MTVNINWREFSNHCGDYNYYKNITNYRNLRTIGRYFFSSTRWLRPIVHIDLYKDEVKKIWNP
jgi:hypothetical protein